MIKHILEENILLQTKAIPLHVIYTMYTKVRLACMPSLLVSSVNIYMYNALYVFDRSSRIVQYVGYVSCPYYEQVCNGWFLSKRCTTYLR